MKTALKTTLLIMLFYTSALIAHPDDIYWSKSFGIPSTDEVRSTLIDGDYVYYNEFGALVRWDNRTKSNKILGLAGSGVVYTIVKHKNYIYIGGSFEHFAGTDANFIARWDGNKWEKVASGINGKVLTICFDNNDNLWIGGIFKKIEGKDSTYIAYRKNGKWQQLPELNNQVRSIINVNGDIYVGGDFSI